MVMFDAMVWPLVQPMLPASVTVPPLLLPLPELDPLPLPLEPPDPPDEPPLDPPLDPPDDPPDNPPLDPPAGSPLPDEEEHPAPSASAAEPRRSSATVRVRVVESMKVH
jgi:hypothetical protein